MKGIILAGGEGSRLFPMTQYMSKQLLPVFDKPIIYYPLAILMELGIKEILIITTESFISPFQRLLHDGSQLGVHIEYAIQDQPRGIADAFIIGKTFIGDDHVTLVLGDNIFYGPRLSETLDIARENHKKATIFGYYVKDPRPYGVVEFDERTGKVKSIIEKPKKPKSNYAVPGLYFYDNNVIAISENLEPSDRGELEITDVNVAYKDKEDLFVQLLGRDVTWFDTGTPEGVLYAANFVQQQYERYGILIGSIEYVAYEKGYITKEQLEILIEGLRPTAYAQALEETLNRAHR